MLSFNLMWPRDEWNSNILTLLIKHFTKSCAINHYVSWDIFLRELMWKRNGQIRKHYQTQSCHDFPGGVMKDNQESFFLCF